ncbi:MAG: 50S ribosomal protein L19 [Candidatus Terrybacteria bacterium]|nr:50S ribosomal protein L19 [Candidatus Terrybacteria bacterium]
MSVDIQQRKKWPIKPGNTVKVWQKIKEGEKTRLQAFEGLVIAHKHGYEAGATFTARKIIDGIGCERIFPLFSPNIEKVDLVRRAKVRRAKLYYVREKAAKEIRKKMKQVRVVAKEVKQENIEESSVKE